MSTHDYPVQLVRGKDLDATMVLVGEAGGLAAIYDIKRSSAMPGLLSVETDFGPLMLDPDEEYEVYDYEGHEGPARTGEIVAANARPDTASKIREAADWLREILVSDKGPGSDEGNDAADALLVAVDEFLYDPHPSVIEDILDSVRVAMEADGLEGYADAIVATVEDYITNHYGDGDDTVRRVYEVEPYGHLEVKATHEGVILDAIDKDGDVVATRAAMAEEIFDDLIVEHELRTCDECGRIDSAGGFLDWINGMCEECDPSILEHPENKARMGE